ncbi:hypothetical protein BURKHO8Y_20104 [Burkholderia sp. 8Y]|nr:hypothetical protein BURKHO8Y_20104 [Burkholderia sp. 8Y]
MSLNASHVQPRTLTAYATASLTGWLQRTDVSTPTVAIVTTLPKASTLRIGTNSHVTNQEEPTEQSIFF